MSWCAKWTAWLTVATLGIVALGGCASHQQRSRQQAERRWKLARAEVKAKLASDQFEVGNVEGAASELAEALRLDPNNPDLIPLQVRVLLAADRIPAAEDVLHQARAQRPPDAQIEYLLGIVRQQQQRWAEALDAFRRAVELDDREVAYVVAAAQAWLQLGEPRPALAFLSEMAPRCVWSSEYQATLAECHEQVGDWPRAASAWRVVVAEEDDARMRERLAGALLRAQRYDEATPILTGLIAENGRRTPPRLRVLLAECYLAAGRGSAAREQVQIVLREQPRNVRALRLLARSLAALGRYGPALRTVHRALTVAPDDPRTLELGAALAWRAGERDVATISATRLLELDERNAVARAILDRSPAPTRDD